MQIKGKDIIIVDKEEFDVHRMNPDIIYAIKEKGLDINLPLVQYNSFKELPMVIGYLMRDGSGVVLNKMPSVYGDAVTGDCFVERHFKRMTADLVLKIFETVFVEKEKELIDL